MQKVNELLSHVLASRTLIDATLSGRRHKKLAITKVTVRPVMLKKLQYQFTDYYPDKVMHRNLYPIDCQEEFVALLMEDYRQAQIFTPTADYHILLNRQNKAKILIQPPSKQAITTSHNRRKNYVIASNPAPPFLTRLGLANQQGRVYPKKMGKFKQINRFLEMVDDVVDYLDTDRELRIVDFGCGKSYLTFALYYYLHEQENLDVNIVGLDIKEAVVDRCNTIAADLGWSKLSFQVGDIKDYQSNSAIDMVVSLHACDTATDMALAQAVAWQS